jgi:hypothetical protein
MSNPWPADQVERRAIGTLTPYAKNARTHSETQINQLAASIREWGWTMPVLVDDDGMIIAGHGRVLAASRVGLDDVPVMVARGWTDAQKRAYVIADNKLTENAGWDDALLALEIADLKELGFDIPLMGFVAGEIDAMLDPGETASLAERFGIVPFSVLNAREGWWQDRKRAWIALGIRSELGRGDASPGGGPMPAADYSQQERGDGRGRPLVERTAIVAGKGWGAGGPARRDPQFYIKKRKWEKDNGRQISTTEFREQHWDGYQRVEVPE